ncbi:MAG: DUF3276 family protein [Anaerolineae bacterium]|nr:DUF3276 family protein [Anaerolineae bacterium]
MTNQTESKTVKSGARTYFFDLKQTQEGKSLLVITETRFKGEGQERERASIVVFPEQAQEFLATVQEMVGKLG